jgi:hypothetical protein
MRKAIAFLALLLVVGFGVWLYFTPQLALASMRDAAAARNAGELSSYVDYPSLRASLKVALQSKMAALAKDQTNPLLALGASLAGNFVDPMIDNLVTPQSMALMLSGVPPTMLEHPPGDSAASSNPDPAAAAPQAMTETSTRYDGLNTYVAIVRRKDWPWQPVELELRRDGLASWKLSAIRLQ